MKNTYFSSLLFGCCLCMPQLATANDSTGYVSTNGIEYLKNPNIAMTSEDLWLSKDKIRVAYRFDNLTPNDISETVVFPLPLVESVMDSDFADTTRLIHSFSVKANGQVVKPTMHTRAFVYPIDRAGNQNTNATPIDVTESFKQCGLSESELRYPWTQIGDIDKISAKLMNCQLPAIQRIKPLLNTFGDDKAVWYGQLVYSFNQKFLAKRPTFIEHTYTPLVGGSVMIHKDNLAPYCASQDRDFLSAAKQGLPYQTMGYILKTGANWAKPIQNFTMTVERDSDEIVSYCWQGNAKKVIKGDKVQFIMKKSNYLPTHDIDIIFINNKAR